jgi:ribonuclease T2
MNALGRAALGLLLLLCAASPTLAAYDLLLLVRQYGPTFCDSTSCSKKPAGKFTLHGLWPNYAQGGFPEYCSNKPFDASSLSKPLKDQLACEWPSYTGSSDSFWEYEYRKHGSCATDIFPQPSDYFQTTLELNDKYDVNDVLDKAGVPFTTSSSPSRTKILSALEAAWGKSSVIKCDSELVSEIWTCFDEGLEMIDCPSSLRNSCPASGLKFPAGAGLTNACQGYFQPVATTTGPAATRTATRTTSRTTAKGTAQAAAGGATGTCIKDRRTLIWSGILAGMVAMWM